MARPTFQIDKQRLRALRIEKYLTQLELATKAKAALLGSENGQSNATLISGYQKIESTGKTSQKMATELAKILGVSVELLQGIEQPEQPEPLDYLKRITSLLKVQIANKENLALQRTLARIADEVDDDPLPHLVKEISERIEAVQLGRNPLEINELVELTGLSESELLKPANVLGHWFVTVKSHLGKKSYIFHDVFEVRHQIKKKIDEHLSHFPLDCSIEMRRDGSWFRMTINARLLMHIDFVRCHPDSKGLCWSQASWRDEFFLYDDFARWAYSAANFVTDFEGKQSPINLQRLRLIVTEEVTTSKVGSFVRSQQRMVISGRLDEIPESNKESSQREGCIHSLYESRLVADLRQALMPHLAEYPAECWKISAYDGITISLTPPRTRGKIVPDELRYRITLVEEVSPNEFVPSPWRQKDLDAQRKKIEGWLKIPYSPSDEDAPIPRFKPI